MLNRRRAVLPRAPIPAELSSVFHNRGSLSRITSRFIVVQMVYQEEELGAERNQYSIDWKFRRTSGPGKLFVISFIAFSGLTLNGTLNEPSFVHFQRGTTTCFVLYGYRNSIYN